MGQITEGGEFTDFLSEDQGYSSKFVAGKEINTEPIPF